MARFGEISPMITAVRPKEPYGLAGGLRRGLGYRCLT